MPEFKLPAIKLRGFREMTSDDIKQALSDVPKPDVRRPDVKLADIADAAVSATQAAAKAAQEAAAAAQSAAQSAAQTVAERAPIGQQKRSRRPLFVLGMVVASLGIVALANADKIRGRVAELSQRARERMEADRVSGSLEPLMTDEEAWTGSVGIPVRDDAYADTLPSAAPQPVGSTSNPYAGAPDPYANPSDPDRPMTQQDAAEVYRS
jgi:hypothetical protein